jgi:hypothetical protein
MRKPTFSGEMARSGIGDTPLFENANAKAARLIPITVT